jgi:hypothetical protein
MLLTALLDFTKPNPVIMDNLKKQLEEHVEDKEVVDTIMGNFEEFHAEAMLKKLIKELFFTAKAISFHGIRIEDPRIGTPPLIYQSWGFNMVLVASAAAVLSWSIKPWAVALGLGRN